MIRRRYRDCQLQSGNCLQCSLLNYHTDCRGVPVSPVELYRRDKGWSQAQLSEKSKVHLQIIYRLESPTFSVENFSAKTVVAVADALGVDVHDLI